MMAKVSIYINNVPSLNLCGVTGCTYGGLLDLFQSLKVIHHFLAYLISTARLILETNTTSFKVLQ